MTGEKSPCVRIQREDFDLAAELALIKESSRTIGGIVSFLGVVRDFSRGEEVEKLLFEYYPGMAEKSLEDLREEAMERFDLVELHLLHRHGELYPGDNVVLILAAAEHREDAFNAAAWSIAELKKKVPIWKKEFTAGGEVWVEEAPSR